MAKPNGVCILPTYARSPWQNGRTERAGKEWKRQFKLARRKEEPRSHSEWIALGELCCSMRNRYNNRSGFSPMQRVFGFNHRLPNSLRSDDIVDPMYLSGNPLPDFRRAKQLRGAAKHAWAAVDDRTKLHQVLHAKHCISENFVEA